MKKFAQILDQLLVRPKKILFWCFIFGLGGIVLDGTIYQLWELGSERKKVREQIVETEIAIETLKKQIKMAHDPKFIEREARDRFDLVNKDDIVFIFNDE